MLPSNCAPPSLRDNTRAFQPATLDGVLNRDGGAGIRFDGAGRIGHHGETEESQRAAASRLQQMRIDDIAVDDQHLSVGVGIDDAGLPVVEHKRRSGRVAADSPVAGNNVVDIVQGQRLAQRGGGAEVDGGIVQGHIASTLKGRVEAEAGRKAEEQPGSAREANPAVVDDDALGKKAIGWAGD